MKRPGVDWYSSTRCQGRGLRCDFALRMPQNKNLISTFSRFFTNLVWPFLQSFVRVLGLYDLYAYNGMCLG